MLRAGLQVLADGEDVAARGESIAHESSDLFVRLAKTEHEARFDKCFRAEAACGAQNSQGSVVITLGPHFGKEAADHFHIVVEDGRARVEHKWKRVLTAAEVRDEGLDGGLGQSLPDSAHDGGHMRRAAVGQIIARDLGDDHVPEVQRLCGFGDVFRLSRIRSCRSAAWNGIKPDGSIRQNGTAG